MMGARWEEARARVVGSLLPVLGLSSDVDCLRFMGSLQWTMDNEGPTVVELYHFHVHDGIVPGHRVRLGDIKSHLTVMTSRRPHLEQGTDRPIPLRNQLASDLRNALNLPPFPAGADKETRRLHLTRPYSTLRAHGVEPETGTFRLRVGQHYIITQYLQSDTYWVAGGSLVHTPHESGAYDIIFRLASDGWPLEDAIDAGLEEVEDYGLYPKLAPQR